MDRLHNAATRNASLFTGPIRYVVRGRQVLTMTMSHDGDDHDARFEAIYRKYFARIFRFFRSERIADGEAQDLAQDTFQRFYEHMPQYRGDGDITYLQAIARSILFNRRRAEKTIKRSATTVDIDDPDVSEQLAAPAEPDYAERQHTEARRKAVARAISSLPPGQKDCLRLRARGRKYNEIASELGISMDAVKSRLRDAKRHLRTTLGEEDGQLAPDSLPEES
jgi:RNA polymerase sigma factor (sigma-70 family)